MAIKLMGTVIELNAPYTEGLHPHLLQKLGVRLGMGANKIKYSTIFSNWDSGRKNQAKVAITKAPTSRMARMARMLSKS